MAVVQIPHCNKGAGNPPAPADQLNVLGLAGIAVGVEEGVEVNLLGLTFGVDPLHRALKLPLIGSLRVRMSRRIGAVATRAGCGCRTCG